MQQHDQLCPQDCRTTVECLFCPFRAIYGQSPKSGGLWIGGLFPPLCPHPPFLRPEDYYWGQLAPFCCPRSLFFGRETNLPRAKRRRNVGGLFYGNNGNNPETTETTRGLFPLFPLLPGRAIWQSPVRWRFYWRASGK